MERTFYRVHLALLKKYTMTVILPKTESEAKDRGYALVKAELLEILCASDKPEASGCELLKALKEIFRGIRLYLQDNKTLFPAVEYYKNYLSKEYKASTYLQALFKTNGESINCPLSFAHRLLKIQIDILSERIAPNEQYALALKFLRKTLAHKKIDTNTEKLIDIAFFDAYYILGKFCFINEKD
ncbi:hypothetical protein ENBRE01_0861 [Enteropsectra breve]|nr:hypothetical protein ENBRE01_0861 [Enteropsectra breve]